MNHPSPIGARALVFACAVFSAQSVACVKALPPPAEPGRTPPTFAGEIPDTNKGDGVVVVESTEGRAKIAVVEGVYAGSAVAGTTTVTSYGVATRQLCDATPCALTLPQGQHQIAFRGVDDDGRMSLATVNVGRSPTVLRHTMGQQRPSGALGGAGFLLSTLSTIGLLTGGTLWLVGSASDHTDEQGRRVASSIEDPGKTITLVSAIGLAAGLTMFFLDRPTQQEGSSTQYKLDNDSGPGGLGVRTNQPKLIVQ